MGSIKVTGLCKAFGIDELFNNVSFEIRRGEHVGFVGANGTGKTTLMKCLLGKMEYDKGNVSIDTADTIGYVEQQAEMTGGATLYEELKGAFREVLALAADKAAMEAEIATDHSPEKLAAYGRLTERFEQAGGYDYEHRIRQTAFGLGFTEEDLGKKTENFSGGQRTRVCLAAALLRKPDFLFLDEPTNHLDVGMIEWLENFLRSYPGGVLIISHDRFFLDRVANRILEIDNKQVTAYEGNYSYYMKVREQRRAAQLTAYEKQQEHIKKTEEYIRKYKAGIKAKQARGRQSQLNRLERLVRPAETAAFNYFAFNPPGECAQRVAELEEVGYAFPDTHKWLFRQLNLLIRKGDGVAIVGPNGAGKTTLLRLLIGELAPNEGHIKLGSRVKLGYFSQQHEGLNMERTLLEELEYDFGLSEEQSRKYLGAFLFHGDDVFRLVGALSGGEQSRLAFLKLMLTGANVLVLDEPTNHLDIPAKEAVEEALSTFPGTYIAVSHDRYFLDKVANCVVEIEDGRITEYDGNYSYYREKKAELLQEQEEAARAEQHTKAGKGSTAGNTGQKAAAVTSTHEESAAKTEDMASSSAEGQTATSAGAVQAEDKKQKAMQNAIKSMSETKRIELLQRTEAEIAMAEAELKMLEHEMNDPSVQADPAKSAEIAQAYADKEQEIQAKYEKWEQLM